MTETMNAGVEILNQAVDYWKTADHAELSPLSFKHLTETLDYVQQHPEEVAKRAQELDMTISRFNTQRELKAFGSDEENSKKLADEILAPTETLPLLAEMPADKSSRFSFFAGFKNLVHHGYYTFLDKPQLEDPKILITGLLVDGYGFALRAKRAIEHKQTVGKDDLIIVNAICEMVQPGTLQTEMYLANWFKPDNGLSQKFCDRIAKQFGDLKPLVGKNVNA